MSIDHVHYQNPQLYTTGHGDYAVDTLKVEIKAVMGKKRRFSPSHRNLLRFFWYDACHHNTDLRAGYDQKRCLGCISCLATFISSSVSYGL